MGRGYIDFIRSIQLMSDTSSRMRLLLKFNFQQFVFLLTLSFGTVSLAQKNNTTLSAKEVQTLKKTEEKLWYVDKAPPKEPKKLQPVKDPSKNWVRIGQTIGELFKVLVWIIAGSAILFALYLIAKNFKGFKPKSNRVIDRIITEESTLESVEELSQVDYATQINNAIENQNYRLAVRLYYLLSIRNLDEAHLIVFSLHKTNRDYMNELKTNPISPTFEQCTRYYDYVWFGNFAINRQQFDKIVSSFSALLSQKI